MLNRSFKSAKCKTSLKLASSRMKLLKNKKEVLLKQLKSDVAQLLESGQDRTARIRVEHVIREEKTMEAYDLLMIYCELIAARLPIVESQKNCPIDLREAITSVIFASPRCAEITEFPDVRKHFTTKYGKEFISAAVELRPDCGVSRMLTEKLSAKAPDLQTKIKVLSAIAEEHNVKWDPYSFEERELRPPDDLLNGPNIFEKANKMHTEPPNVQASSSKVHAPLGHDKMQNAPMKFECNASSSTSSQNFASMGGRATVPATSHSGVRHSGTGSERMEVGNMYSGDENAFSLGRQNWKMEFKDATAAAQAAAESAELAGMAARAAAELSSREKITKQCSIESQMLNNQSLRDEGPRENSASGFLKEQLDKDSGYNIFQDKSPHAKTEQVDRNRHDNQEEAAERFYEDGHVSTKSSSRAASLRSSTASIDENKLMNDFQSADRCSQKSSFEEDAIKAEKNSTLFSGISMKKQFSGSEVEFVSGQKSGLQSCNLDYSGEERIRKQASNVSSRSHSSNHVDYHNISPSSRQKFGVDSGKDPFVGINQKNSNSDTGQTSSYNSPAVMFDEFGSYHNDFRFDTRNNYDGQESKLYTASPDRKSSAHLSVNKETWSPRKNFSASLEKSSSVSHISADWQSPPKFNESLTNYAHHSQPDDLLTVTYDDCESPSSESEGELDNSRFGRKMDPTILPHKENMFFRNTDDIQNEIHGLTASVPMGKGNSGSNNKQDLYYSLDDDELTEVRTENSQGTEFCVRSQRKFGFDEVLSHQSSARHSNSQMVSNDMVNEPYYNPVEEWKRHQYPQSSKLSPVNEFKATHKALAHESPDAMKDDELFNQSGSESAMELNFGTLKGGLRNKGNIRPHYTSSPSGDVLASRKAAGDRETSTDHSPASPEVKSSLNSGLNTVVKNKSIPRAPTTHYDLHVDDSKEELPQQDPYRKGEPYNPKASKQVNTKSKFSAPVTLFDYGDDHDSEQDLPRQNFTTTGHAESGYSWMTKATPIYGTNSYLRATVDPEAIVNSDADAEKTPSRSSYGSETPTKPQSQTRKSGGRRSSPGPSTAKQATPKPMPESNISLRESSAKEQPSSPHVKVTSANTGSRKEKTSGGEAPSRESSLKKASHVHPKLPDYDTISAQFQSLRMNRK